MAHTILGIDLGSYSIKVAHIEAGFRTFHLLALHERRLLPEETGETLLTRQVRTLKTLLTDLSLRPEMSAAALSDAAMIRVVNLPFFDPKKIEQILPFELEGQLLGEPTDHVIDHLVSQAGLSLEEGQAGEGVRLLAAAAPKETIREVLEHLGEAGQDVRLLGAALLSTTSIFAAKAWDSQTSAAPEAPVVILNLGHRTTQVAIVKVEEGGLGLKVHYGRTIPRGGFHTTQSIARALQVSEERATELKHSFDLDPKRVGSKELVDTVRESLRPLIRELRQTLSSYVSLYGLEPGQILLTGGGAKLKGIAAFLTEELALPVDTLALPSFPGPKGQGAAIPDQPLDDVALSCSSALGLAQALTMPTPQVNFRKGEFAYRTDYSFLRERAGQLAALLMAVLLCAGLSAVASLRGLQKESEQLRASLRTQTKNLFGDERTDGRAISSELNSMIASTRGGGQSIPTISALDLLEEISKVAPQTGASDKKAVGLDVTELHIRSKKTDIKATAASSQYIDDLKAALAKIPCFKQIEQGKTVSFRQNGPDGKPVDVKQFSFAITTTCP